MTTLAQSFTEKWNEILQPAALVNDLTIPAFFLEAVEDYDPGAALTFAPNTRIIQFSDTSIVRAVLTFDHTISLFLDTH